MGCYALLADVFTSPRLLNIRLCSSLCQTRKQFPHRMSSPAANSNPGGGTSKAVEEGLKLVYTPMENTAVTAPSEAVEDRSGEDTAVAGDGCTSTSFKPRRAFCHTCRKAQSLCICVRIKTIVDNKVGITILQHPQEKDHHLGTARIAALSLRNIQVLSLPEADGRTSFRIRDKVPGSKRSIAGRVGNKGKKKLDPQIMMPHMMMPEMPEMVPDGAPECDGDDVQLVPSWLDLPAGVGLLFPSEKAIDLVPEFCGGEDGPTHLIVLDGTWSKAKRIYFENRWLHTLQHYNLPLSVPSMYGSVRREPKVGCLSTVESIVFALKLLEPATVGLDALLEVFDSMIEDAKGFQAQTELKYLEQRRGAVSESP